MAKKLSVKAKPKKEILHGCAADYELVEGIGHGGYGETYKAIVVKVKNNQAWLGGKKLKLGDFAVVKRPHIDPNQDPGEILNFINKVNVTLNKEITTLDRLKNLSSVAKVVDCGVTQTKIGTDIVSQRFIVQEFIEGESLLVYLKKKYPTKDKKFHGIHNERGFFSLAMKLAIILKQIHQNRVIHGDIWPSNILIKNKKPIFIDFGGSVFRDSSYLLAEDQYKLTHVYIAPERRRGERHGRRSDIYSLGGILYKMATGEDPPKPIADHNELKDTIVGSLKDLNPDLIKRNHGVADIICRCLRYSKYNRMRSADALISEIRTFSFELAKSVSRIDLPNLADQVHKKLKKMIDPSHPDLLVGLLELDLSIMASRIEDMIHGILDLSGDHEVVVTNLCRYLSILREEDSFFTWSIPKLWSSENLGINGRFLTMNRLIALRGVRVRHIFLTCDEDINDPDVERIFKAHLSTMKEVKDQLNPESKGSFEVYYRMVNSNERDNQLNRGWHKCAVIQKKSAYYIEPIYDTNKIIRTVRFRSRGAQPSHCVSEIKKEIEKAYPLERWFQKPVNSDSCITISNNY